MLHIQDAERHRTRPCCPRSQDDAGQVPAAGTRRHSQRSGTGIEIVVNTHIERDIDIDIDIALYVLVQNENSES